MPATSLPQPRRYSTFDAPTRRHLSHLVIANAVLLAGPVQIGDRALLGGGAVVHPFCRIGEGVMIGGGARRVVSADEANDDE